MLSVRFHCDVLERLLYGPPVLQASCTTTTNTSNLAVAASPAATLDPTNFQPCGIKVKADVEQQSDASSTVSSLLLTPVAGPPLIIEPKDGFATPSSPPSPPGCQPTSRRSLFQDTALDLSRQPATPTPFKSGGPPLEEEGRYHWKQHQCELPPALDQLDMTSDTVTDDGDGYMSEGDDDVFYDWSCDPSYPYSHLEFVPLEWQDNNQEVDYYDVVRFF